MPSDRSRSPHQHTLKAADVTRIYDLMSEFTFIEGFALGTLYKFAILPNEFLIMVLVIAMGILGSTLQLTHDCYRAGCPADKPLPPQTDAGCDHRARLFRWICKG